MFKSITSDQKKQFNSVVLHPLQTYEWGEFREKTGLKVIRRGSFQNNKLISAFQLTIHPIPKTPFTIGYLPKGDVPTKELLAELKRIGKEENCIFIQLEPNCIKSDEQTKTIAQLSLRRAFHPLFTKYTFILDLTQSEEALLKNMHHKARYNIKVAQKHGVLVKEDNSESSFNKYLLLSQETTTRQKFYAHSEQYHRFQWEILPHKKTDNTTLSSHLLLAIYQHKILASWILFVFKDTLYYPYGASSSEHKEVMASNLIMWEAIRFGKKLGLKSFDMWGALEPNPNSYDPWFGFHNFKQRYGPEHVEFIGSFDLVINPIQYEGYKVLDKLRWLFLRIKK